jgi:hypothetical protein
MTNEATGDQDILSSRCEPRPRRSARRCCGCCAGEVHPQLIVLAMAQVTGELAASAALAGGQDGEPLLGELAKVMRHAGREHHQTLQAERLPLAGSA